MWVERDGECIECGCRGCRGAVWAAVLAELTGLGVSDGGVAVPDTADAQVALNLAAVLDDRAGIQGVAATAKQLETMLATLRARYAKPAGKSTLELLRGTG